MRRFPCVGISAIIAVVSCGVQAEEGAVSAAATNAVPETVVTALRYEADTFDIPYASERLDGGELQQHQAIRTTPDALKGLPSVMLQKTGYGQGSPFIRGFTGFRTLILIDGIRLNNSVFREGPNQYWSTIDPLSLSGFDVVMGPGSTLYGSDAIGGVVNALPNDVPDYEGQPTWARRVYYRGATAEDSHIGRIQAGARPSDDFGFAGGVSLKSFGDLEGGKDVGTQEHTGYDEYDFDVRADYFVGDKSRLSLVHQTVDQDDAWRTHRTIYGIDWEGLTKGDDKVHSFDQHRDLTYLRLRTEEPAAALDSLTLTVSRHMQTEDLHRVRANDAQERQGFDVETWGADAQLETGANSGRWVYGVEYYHDIVDSYARKYKADGSLSSVEIQGPVADDATYDIIGAYVQDTLPLLNDRIEITPGARYTYAEADAEKVKDPVTGDPMSVEGDWDAAVGSLRVLAPLQDDKSLALFGGVSQGFRAPNLSDLTRLDTARSGELETPVTDLDPEQFVALEAGIRSRGDRHTAQLVYYHTFIEDMIVRAPTGREVDGLLEVTKKNSGDGYVQGVEGSGTLDVADDWQARLTATWMYGEVDTFPTSSPEEERDYLSRIMPPTVEIAVKWDPRAGRFWAEAVCTAADEADKLSADDKRDTQRIPPGGTPGYVVVTARAGARVTQQVDLTLALENISDEDYRIHGSGVNEPGRNLVLTADCEF